MKPGRYLLILLTLGLIGGPLLYFGQWVNTVLPCKHLDRPGAYLAFCANTAFADYEHAAYAYGLERKPIRNVRRAEVLFLGNSRTQAGFSSRATDAFFDARHVIYHMLGFGYGESSAFPTLLLRDLRPAPKVVIINADPFFQNVRSPIGDQMFKEPLSTRIGGLMRFLFVRMQPTLCRMGLCIDRDVGFYRDRRTGQWIWQDVLLPRDVVGEPVLAEKHFPSDVAGSLPGWVATARAFLELLPTPRRCILLTGVPTPTTNAEAQAAALGAALGLDVIQPNVEQLFTYDTSHLNADSAERWSAAFLAAAAPRIDACLGIDQPGDGATRSTR